MIGGGEVVRGEGGRCREVVGGWWGGGWGGGLILRLAKIAFCQLFLFSNFFLFNIFGTSDREIWDISFKLLLFSIR